ncbi:uncharacterized protein [Castor canadensis]|uniref:Uncharacterized protein n=1 Tax=Castor canadensis TaxID=51338 RepID=A0AC58LKW0_CASCN
MGEPGGAGRGGRGGLNGAARLPGKSQDASWVGGGKAGAQGWGPSPSASAPSIPHWWGERSGRGAGGAALTSLRAVPAREGGAGSRSEPGEAARSQEPPAPPLPMPASRSFGHAPVRAGEPGGRPDLGLSLGTRLIRGGEATVTAAAPPPPSPLGAPAPFRVRVSSLHERFPIPVCTQTRGEHGSWERTGSRVRRQRKEKQESRGAVVSSCYLPVEERFDAGVMWSQFFPASRPKEAW